MKRKKKLVLCINVCITLFVNYFVCIYYILCIVTNDFKLVNVFDD